MGRKKIKKSLKKAKLSVTITTDNAQNLTKSEIENKSKFINDLLKSHFGIKDEKHFDAIEMIYNQELVTAEAMTKFPQ